MGIDGSLGRSTSSGSTRSAPYAKPEAARRSQPASITSPRTKATTLCFGVRPTGSPSASPATTHASKASSAAATTQRLELMAIPPIPDIHGSSNERYRNGRGVEASDQRASPRTYWRRHRADRRGARTVLIAATAIADEYLDGDIHLFKFMHDELHAVERKHFPGGYSNTK
jgi:hypothetical protein